LKVWVCFVCLGNICRSPTAEGIMRKLVEDAGLEDAIGIASAGTGAWHVGDKADPRSRETAERRGVLLTSRAQKFETPDFDRFDYVLAMDAENLAHLQQMDRSSKARAEVSLLRRFEPGDARDENVPDPYYGGDGGFDRVFDICHASCQGLLDHIVARHELA
jgi:protein-tyrosine phosphatase